MEIGSTHTQSYPVSSSLLNGMDTAAPGVAKAGGRHTLRLHLPATDASRLRREALLLSHSPLPSHIGLRRRVYHEKPAELPAESAEAYLPDDIFLPVINYPTDLRKQVRQMLEVLKTVRIS